MSDQLEGRDLDRACAEAMHGPSIIWRHWSTDPRTQAEKLAWLRKQDWRTRRGELMCSVGEIRISEVVADCPEPVRVEAIGLPPPAWAYGATIDEALARLVCAVAKAKKEQKP